MGGSMEKYDNIVKIEEIRRLSDNNQYGKALDILNTMDINKIKALTDLSIIADVLTQNERYDDARMLLTKMYTKSKTRRTLYQLVELSIKCGNVSDAEEYLELYIKAAPQDFYRYIFRYCIDKISGKPYEALMTSLEQLKEYEYIEKWAYELAKLYHKAGMKDMCVRECSDIILWFGDGLYVEKAKLLKGYYVGEINPIHMLKAKEKRDAEKKLGLDKTKDYSTMKDQIDQFLKEEEKEKESLEGSSNKQDEESIEETQELVEVEEPLEAEDLVEAEEFEEAEGFAEAEELVGAEEFVEAEEPVETEELVETEEYKLEDEFYEEEKYETVGDSIDLENHDIPKETDEQQQHEEYVKSEEILHETPDQTILDNSNTSIPNTENITTSKVEQLYQYTGIDFEKIFGYFIEIPSLRDQIENCLENMVKDNTRLNMSVCGDKKSGKTELGKRFAKAYYCLKQISTTRVAKITAMKLNKINIDQKSKQLVDGTLIIEEVGSLNSETVEKLLHFMWKLDGRLIVILEDNEQKIYQLFENYPKFASEFRNTVILPPFTKQDYIGFMTSYIAENEYGFTNEAKTTIFGYTDAIVRTIEPENQFEAVMNLIKKVKTAADERNIKALSNIVGSRNLSSSDFVLINEEDILKLEVPGYGK